MNFSSPDKALVTNGEKKGKRGVSFSRIFSDKNNLVICFPKKMDINLKIFREVVIWSDYFKRILLILPGYQKEFFVKLNNRPEIHIASIDETGSVRNHNFLLVLTTDKRVQKRIHPNNAQAVLGLGKKINIRLNPPTKDPLGLCKKMVELIKIPDSGLNNTALIEKGYLNDLFIPGKNQVKEESKRRFVFDLNTLYNKIRISGEIKRLAPPHEYLLLKTKKPQKKASLKSVRYDSGISEELFKTYNLYETLKYCSGAKSIITDNRIFFNLLQELSFGESVLFCTKRTPMGQINNFIQKI